MTFGKFRITPHAVETPQNSYRIELLSVVSVRRPFLPLGVIALFGGAAFAWRFQDLLYPHELLAMAVVIPLLAMVGVALGHMQFLSRDLRGTPQTGAVWGTAPHLNRLRRQIMRARDEIQTEPQT
ncbi:hypothetical protein ACOTTU_17010 [Roseobacter sp. EG26]|uniref:hypothetical protein n=1 Tax=Roseobacter sp. EG26 TaxID=3412477 RepID=UPI003CE4CFF5